MAGWAELILSNRQPNPGHPLLGPVPLQLDSHETLTSVGAVAPSTRRLSPITHPIPQNAPAGIYEYRAKVGLWPDAAQAERDFYFLVQP